ncbi:DUF305 domain-containing protein [bacterium]|nr:DUF305 domain-containing protein [bacterium]
MALSMFFLSLFMPLIMIASPADYFIGPTQVFGAVFMAIAMFGLEGTMHTMPTWAWIFTIVVLIGTVIAIRSQFMVDSVGYLRDMIPHHSMAILTSQRLIEKGPGKNRPEIQDLAENILATQKTEVAQMKLWVNNARKN